MNTKRTKFAAKTVVASLALAGSLTALAPAAHAERVPRPTPGSTSLDFQCYNMQQEYLDLVRQFKAAYNANDRAAMDTLIPKINNPESGWSAAGCKAVFGSIRSKQRRKPCPHSCPRRSGPLIPPRSRRNPHRRRRWYPHRQGISQVATASLGWNNRSIRVMSADTSKRCPKSFAGYTTACSPGWTRTSNPSVNSRMLCQLSYRGLLPCGLGREPRL
jgi:hypothetical protein